MIEILISIGLLAIIAALGLFISFDFYRSYAFRSERSTIVSVLQKARSQSLNNIDQVRHGAHFVSGQYIIFECPTSTPQCTGWTASSSDNPISAAYSISITNPALPLDIIFDQLSAISSDRIITVSDGVKSYNIAVNSQGQIDW